MNELYPLKFEPQYFEKPWGGNHIAGFDALQNAPADHCGEAWLLSGVTDKNSVVSNGFLAGNELNELVEIYMEDLVGEKVFVQYGDVFPILIKIIDTNDWLSVQVHPDNKLAMQKHGVPFGKTEMWYILQASENAALLNGFRNKTNRTDIEKVISDNSVSDFTNRIAPKVRETYFTPAGRIHALGPGLTLAEIQQTSDFTYRLSDWGRTDSKGQLRELHVADALDALKYDDTETGLTKPVRLGPTMDTLVSCGQFVTNRISLHPGQKIRRSYMTLDSFVILFTVQGDAVYEWEGNEESLRNGECILVPAAIDDLLLSTKTDAEILEVFIQN